MLVWSSRGRAFAWGIAAIVIVGVFAAPMLVIVLASLAGQWNGILPINLTIAHYSGAMQGEYRDQIVASIVTGAIASLVALSFGTWAALVLKGMRAQARRLYNLVFFIPSAVPSVSVGLGLLVAFSRPPVLLNGTIMIVVAAHLVLVLAFSFGNVSAGLDRLPPEIDQMAESLGARPLYRLRRVTIPMVMPYLLSAFCLSFALSMGELGATVMVYPPGWVTLPVGIFALTDRGEIFSGAALAVVLVVGTLAVLFGTSLIPNRAAQR
ncbi:MAG TPA: ABC transporter permease subunit [Lichenihabitans sp.]|nr:ABC transporter permease subunit [Lichenihabitans sp.]